MLLLIPLLPLLGFVLNASFGRRVSKTVSGGIGVAAVFASFAVSAWMSWSLVARPAAERVVDQVLFTWIPSGDLQVPFALRLDPLSMVMILVVSGVGALIHVYSVAYMHDERDGEYARYFSYLNLFAAFMLILVLAPNFLVMFVGWEGVGLCSYLLIGFWYEKKSASDAGKKAFIVNRVGDFGFLLGVLLIFSRFGTLDFHEVARAVSAYSARDRRVRNAVGCHAAALCRRRRQVGPDPALRLAAGRDGGPDPGLRADPRGDDGDRRRVHDRAQRRAATRMRRASSSWSAIVGVATAVLVGHDRPRAERHQARAGVFDRVAARVTCSSRWASAPMRPASSTSTRTPSSRRCSSSDPGAVIHALAGEQDLRRMGGLRKDLPITYWTFLVGTLAIAGVPLLSGFFSKDELLYRAYSNGHPYLWFFGTVTSLLTACYMFRLFFLAFHGERATNAPAASPAPHGDPDAARGGHGAGHGRLHDAPRPMAIVLVVLAIGAVLAGYVGVPGVLGGSNRIEHFLEPSFVVETAGEAAGAAEPASPAAAAHGEAGDEALEGALMLISTLVALTGIGLAWVFFLKRRDLADAAARRFRGLHRLLLNKYYVDEIYDAAIVQPVRIVSEQALWKGLDVGAIDGAVNGAGVTVRGASRILRRLQTGSIRAYAASLMIGAIVVLGYMLWR